MPVTRWLGRFAPSEPALTAIQEAMAAWPEREEVAQFHAETRHEGRDGSADVFLTAFFRDDLGSQAPDARG